MNETRYDTNPGWWTEKPERSAAGPRFWRNCVWIVALATALVCTLTVAASQ